MSLQPILEGARSWCPPADVQERFGAAHFAIRAAERGVKSVPGHLLMWVVLEALARGRDDLVAPVFPIGDGSVLYRILLPEGPFYPVLRGGRAVTIYSRREKRQQAAARKFRKRCFGTRLRRVQP